MTVLLSYAKPLKGIKQSEVMRSLLGESGFALNSKNYFHIETIPLDEPRLPSNWTTSEQELANIMNQEIPKQFLYFRIPKASGGSRPIEAPEHDYKVQLRDMTDVLVNKMRVLPHDAAYAYTRGRCAKDALIYHQQNKARWFLKLDIKDFFTSITEETLKNILPSIYPLNFLNPTMLSNLTSIAVNTDGVLPQGSPLSPLLSNLVMVRFDAQLRAKLHWYKRDKFFYTRYADDILISSPYDFKFREIVDLVDECLTHCGLPLELNRSKTRYQSFSGSNWNLGLMYTKERNITIGRKKKQEYSFLLDLLLKNPESFSEQETQSLVGKISYLASVEPRYCRKMILKYEQKHNKNYSNVVKEILG